MTLAYSALALVLAISAGALLSRALVTPGRRPAETDATDLGWCPTEQRTTLHAYALDDTRTCWICRTRTPGGAR